MFQLLSYNNNDIDYYYIHNYLCSLYLLYKIIGIFFGINILKKLRYKIIPLHTHYY